MRYLKRTREPSGILRGWFNTSVVSWNRLNRTTRLATMMTNFFFYIIVYSLN
jgi:hypothetical protein